MKRVCLLRDTKDVAFVRDPRDADEVWTLTEDGKILKSKRGGAEKANLPKLRVRVVSPGVKGYIISARNREVSG